MGKDSLMLNRLSESYQKATSLKVRTSVKVSSHRRKPSKDLRQTTTDVPSDPTTEAQGNGNYTCTTCHRHFNKKYEWKRHEESQHNPQQYWICMHGDPAIPISTHPSGIASPGSAWICAFCDAQKANRELMVDHLIRRHKINICARKRKEDRTFTRKDKLKQHLQQVHALGDGCERWEDWNEDARRKWAWGCGFCGGCSFTWNGMLMFYFVALFLARFLVSYTLSLISGNCPSFLSHDISLLAELLVSKTLLCHLICSEFHCTNAIRILSRSNGVNDSYYPDPKIAQTV